MFIKYFIPEDGDDIAHPNTFKLENNQPTLADIKKVSKLMHQSISLSSRRRLLNIWFGGGIMWLFKIYWISQAFPVPGVYHFRFQKSLGSHVVWMDINDEYAVVPMYQGAIFIKVTRIAAAASSSSFVPSQSSTAASSSSTGASAAAAPKSTSPPTKAPKPLDRKHSEKLLKFDDDVTTPTPNPSEFYFAVMCVLFEWQLLLYAKVFIYHNSICVFPLHLHSCIFPKFLQWSDNRCCCHSQCNVCLCVCFFASWWWFAGDERSSCLQPGLLLFLFYFVFMNCSRY